MVKDICDMLCVPRSSYYSWLKDTKEVKEYKKKLRDAKVLNEMEEIKLQHPFWGYRRVWAWLFYRESICVNRKRVYRIMKENGLLVSQKNYEACRTPQRSKPRADRPRQFWGIDMTKFMIPSMGWAYLVVVLDWYRKKAVGWDISTRSRTEEWKRALNMAINKEFSDGVRGNGLKLISDNGTQPTSVNFIKEMSSLGIEQIFTSYNNPKGNADTERMMRTIKEEVVWLEEFSSLEEAKGRLNNWFEKDYNSDYVHSALGYMSPEEFENNYYGNLKRNVA